MPPSPLRGWVCEFDPVPWARAHGATPAPVRGEMRKSCSVNKSSHREGIDLLSGSTFCQHCTCGLTHDCLTSHNFTLAARGAPLDFRATRRNQYRGPGHVKRLV